MRRENITFTGARDTVLPAILWLPETEPTAVLQITHGMTEHMGRYESLAEALCPLGVVLGEEASGAAVTARNLIARFICPEEIK